MKDLVTSGGRLLSVSVEGGQPNVQDTMVAAVVYLHLLEESFSTAEQLVSCFRSWTEDNQRGPGNLSDEQLERSRRWMEAHHHADRSARKFLSDPDKQSFRLVLRTRDRRGS